MILAIGGQVVYHEAACEEGQLISQGFDRALEKHPVLVRVLVLITAAHLINWLPKQVDPYHGIYLITKGTE